MDDKRNFLKTEIKNIIAQELSLIDVKAEDISDSDSLFQGSLGLDSLDAVELSVLIERKFGKKIQTADQGKKILYSVDTIADFLL